VTAPAHEATLHDVIASVRAAAPVPFLLSPDGHVILTYADAAAQSARLAHVMIRRGANSGDRVAVQVQKSPAAVVAYLACIRAGLVLLPMNTAYTPAEVAYLVADAQPRLVLDDSTLHDVMAEAAGLPAGCESFTGARVTAGDLAAILYTSGTTGRPKGAMLSHGNLASNAVALHQLWGFSASDVLLHALPIFHTHGLFVAINCALLSGIPMVFMERFDADTVVRALPRCTVMMGVPTFYTRLLQSPEFDASCCGSMRLFISGSAPLLATTHDEFAQRTGHAILERYGMTETSMLTSNPLHGERRPGSVGHPLPDVDVRVAADDGTVCPAGVVGGVEVRGPNVFGGYWARPGLAVTEFTADGFFRTGDLGHFDADGYLHIVGRSKDLIISGGLNIYPKEIEAVLDDLDGVAESAVIGISDPDFGEAVVAVVVAEPGCVIDAEALRAACRERLAGFKVPRTVHVVDDLPRNAMGKVQKALLRAAYSTE
jgi:malonyl-CoA/methylmalonyl-CoA synthetase